VTDAIDDANGGAGVVVDAGAVDVVVVARVVLVGGPGAVVAVVDVLVEVDSLDEDDEDDEDEPDRDAVVVVPVARTGSPVVSRTTR